MANIGSAPRVIAIVPAFNEEGNIASAIEDLKLHSPSIDYIIINDGSTDDTEKICIERGYNHITLPVNLGLAGAFQTGMRFALENDYDFALQFDADGQHCSSYIKDMISAALSQDAKVVIGSRFAATKKPVSARMAGSAIITAMIFVTTGKKVQDPTSGMRLISKDLIPLFAEELDFSPEPDTVALLMQWGHKVCEVQVEMRDRITGKSYLTFTRSLAYMMRVGISILFVQWIRRKKS